MITTQRLMAYPDHLDYLDLFAINMYSCFFVNTKGMSNYYSVLFQHIYCINVPIHVYGAAVGEI
jgi:hypothetical protein